MVKIIDYQGIAIGLISRIHMTNWKFNALHFTFKKIEAPVILMKRV